MSREAREVAQYYTKVAWKAAMDSPRECIVYAVLVEFLVRHKNPPYRFILYPQMSLKWKPGVVEDPRHEITDLGLVIFTRNGYKLRCGVEAKRAAPIMAELPDAKYLIGNLVVRNIFILARYQAMDQAKAAFKNDFCFNPKQPIHWMLVVGPYWTPIQLGPYSEAELTVRSHKKSSTEDFRARINLDLLEKRTPFELKELHCLNSPSSYDRIEEILEETDGAARPFIDGILGRVC